MLSGTNPTRLAKFKMLGNQVFYHSSIKNTIVAFGNLFSNIKIARKNKNGVIEQTIHVPIAYSQKEKWVHAIEANPDNERGIYTALPRLGFEITGYSYDSSRKLPRMNTIHCKDPNTGGEKVFTPVPYNLEISLYFATKNQEDALQILEQILPTFTPEYTLAIKAVPELNIVTDVPFILNSVSVQDDYEGDLETRRFVIHTLSFTAKINLFGGITTADIITQVEANLDTTLLNPGFDRFYVASQTNPSAPLNENWLDNF